MGQVKKVTVTRFGGMQDSKRKPFESGAHLIKNFDIYTDRNKLKPVPGFIPLIEDDEKKYNLKAIGGTGSTLYASGSGLTDWYSAKWLYRVLIEPIQASADETILIEENGTSNSFNSQGTSSDNQVVAWYYHSGSPSGTINRVTVSAQKVGSPTGLRCVVYADNGGNPGTILATKDISADLIPSSAFGDVIFDLDSDLVLPTNFFVGFYGLGNNGSNYVNIQYQSTGSRMSRRAGTSLTNWADYDTSSTPNIKLSYSDDPYIGFYSSEEPIMMLDLANMPADFWTHVREDGMDIRIVRKSDNTMLRFDVRNFDADAQEGQVWFNSNSAEDVYVYYGNATASDSITYQASVPQSLAENTWSNFTFFFNLDGDVENAGNNDEELGTGTPVFTDGLYGQGLTGSTVNGDADDQLGNVGDDFMMVMAIYIPANATGTIDIIDHSDFTIGIDATKKLLTTVNGDNSSSTITGTTALETNKWNIVAFHYLNGDHYQYINGALDKFSYENDGGVSPSFDYLTLDTTFGTSGNLVLDHIGSFRMTASGANLAKSWYYMMRFNDLVYDIGAEESFADTEHIYGGFQAYTGNVDTGDWEEDIENGQPVRDMSYYPTPSFAGTEAGSFTTLVSGEPELGGFWYQGITDFPNPFDANNTLLAVFVSQKAMPVTAAPADGGYYFTMGGSTIYEAGDPAVTAYSAQGAVQSMEPYQTFLAVASTRRNRAKLEIWDLVNDDPIENVDLGVGYARVAGTAGPTLFAVVDGFIDDEVLSARKPVMELHEYIGGGEAVMRQRYEMPVNTDANLTESWGMPVSQIKAKLQDSTLFWAKLPANEDATEFNQGFYAVGRDPETGALDLSLYVETDALGDVEFAHVVANQMVVIHNRDGSVSRLRDDGVYNLTSVYESLAFSDDDLENKKRLVGVEVYTEPLDEGQTIRFKVREKDAATWTTVFEHAEEGSTAREATQVENQENANADGEGFTEFRELDIRLESTGGGAAITGYALLYEVLDNDIP